MCAVQTQTIHKLNSKSLVTVYSECLLDEQQLSNNYSDQTLYIPCILTYPQGLRNKPQTFFKLVSLRGVDLRILQIHANLDFC